MRKDMRIGLVELYASKNGNLWGRQRKDLYSIVRLPSRATHLLAAILMQAGYSEVKTFNPIYNRFGGRFHTEELKELAGMDVVGISAITRTQPPSYELARTLKEINPRIKIVFGGPHVTVLPDEALEYGDVVVRKEGDVTLVELMDRMVQDFDDPWLADLPGISYKDRYGELVHNPDRPFISSEELSALPFPVFPAAVTKGITHSVIVTSRGCPYHCEFCAVITHFGSGYRFIDEERTVALIEHTLEQTRKPIFFGDDNFNARPKRTRNILERLLQKGVSMPESGIQVRVETAWDSELLGLLRKVRCNRIYVGLESINEETLRIFNKHSSREKNEEAIQRFNAAGFSVHGMFVLGSDEDTVETVRETVKFAKRTMLSTAQFFCLTALPGTPMSARYQEQGKVLSKDWHLYDAHHVIIQPEKMEPHVFQQEMDRANREFYSLKESLRHLLFSNDKIYNSTIRILGKILTLKINFQMIPYRRQLKALDRWSEEVDGRYQKMVRYLRGKGQGYATGKSQSTRTVKNSVEEFLRWLRRSLEAIPKAFLPYCQRYIGPKKEALREFVVSVESSGGPVSTPGRPPRP